jgi:hypothetical protein
MPPQPSLQRRKSEGRVKGAKVNRFGGQRQHPCGGWPAARHCSLLHATKAALVRSTEASGRFQCRWAQPSSQRVLDHPYQTASRPPPACPTLAPSTIKIGAGIHERGQLQHPQHALAVQRLSLILIGGVITARAAAGRATWRVQQQRQGQHMVVKTYPRWEFKVASGLQMESCFCYRPAPALLLKPVLGWQA